MALNGIKWACFKSNLIIYGLFKVSYTKFIKFMRHIYNLSLVFEGTNILILELMPYGFMGIDRS